MGMTYLAQHTMVLYTWLVSAHPPNHQLRKSTKDCLSCHPRDSKSISSAGYVHSGLHQVMRGQIQKMAKWKYLRKRASQLHCGTDPTSSYAPPHKQLRPFSETPVSDPNLALDPMKAEIPIQVDGPVMQVVKYSRYAVIVSPQIRGDVWIGSACINQDGRCL